MELATLKSMCKHTFPLQPQPAWHTGGWGFFSFMQMEANLGRLPLLGPFKREGKCLLFVLTVLPTCFSESLSAYLIIQNCLPKLLDPIEVEFCKVFKEL